MGIKRNGSMTPEQARELAERIGNAKKDLMEALSLAEETGSAGFISQLNTLCGKTEALQAKATALARK